ncbi:MAG: DUF4230 domain-containing protein [Paludibacteraceae bacterium]|nr:DUF4230 domain-containing protein [Paludibacteraceae bacterium]
MKKIFIPKAIIMSPIFWILLVIGFALLYFTKNFEITKSNKIEETSIDITAIKDISEWEFLTIQREEFIDTTLRSKQLACIYTGTIRLGLNMKHAKKKWAVCSHDTARLELPAIEILDNNFIDEASTRTFYSKGNISASLKEGMYREAKRQMKAKALTSENIRTAETNAKDQFSRIFKNLGFNVVLIQMEECIE